MTLPWNAQQVEWLQAMGLEVLARPPAAPVAAEGITTTDATAIPAGLLRAARGVDIAALIEARGLPRDVAARRAFWAALRPLRKASAG